MPRNLKRNRTSILSVTIVTASPRIHHYMKTITKSLFTAGLALSAAAFAFAGPPSTFQTLNHPEQFQQLKAGDKVLYVCNQCKTVSEVTIASSAQAMEHCKEGATLTCPACNAKVKVTMKGPKNQSMDHEVTYTNAKGEECFFVAKVADKK
jgi:DNA-directed RNA polymerase subunit RPC12/RpoP